MSPQIKLVVLISGNGSNLQAIIDEIEQGTLHADITRVISNRPEVSGLQRAQRANIATQVIDHKAYPSRESFDQAMMNAIDKEHPDLIVLAGFMRILSDSFVEHYLGRLINIHPSLLPNYQGLNTHQRILDANEAKHGATVHYVIPELDSGPIILQASLPVLSEDNAETLAQRVHQLEHKLYPESIRRIAAGQVTFSNGVVNFEQQPITYAQQQYKINA